MQNQTYSDFHFKEPENPFQNYILESDFLKFNDSNERNFGTFGNENKSPISECSTISDNKLDVNCIYHQSNLILNSITFGKATMAKPIHIF